MNDYSDTNRYHIACINYVTIIQNEIVSLEMVMTICKVVKVAKFRGLFIKN